MNLKAFAKDRIDESERLKFVSRMIQNNVGKGENADYQHFLLSYNVFMYKVIESRVRVSSVQSVPHNHKF